MKEIKQVLLILEEQSKCLKRIAQVTYLQFNLKYLDGKFKQIFLLYVQNQEIDLILANFEKNKTSQLFKITIKELKSLGQALRQIHLINKIENQFLILFADNFCNINLKYPIQQILQKKTKKNLLTIFLQRQNYTQQAFLIKKPNQIIQIKKKTQHLELDLQKIKCQQINKYQIRCDLSDVNIYLCSLQVLNAFKQNFFFNQMKDLIQYILQSEINQEIISFYQLKEDQYSLRYLQQSHFFNTNLALINNRLLPYTIQNVQKQFKIKNKYNKGNFQTYFINSPKIHITSSIYRSLIGRDIQIGKYVIIMNCVIGNNIKIRDYSKLYNCFIQDNVIISQKSTYKNSLIKPQFINQIQNKKIVNTDNQQLFKIISSKKNQQNIIHKGNQVQQTSLIQHFKHAVINIDQRQNIAQEVVAYVRSQGLGTKIVINLVINQLKIYQKQNILQWINQWSKFLNILLRKCQDVFIQTIYQHVLKEQKLQKYFSMILQVIEFKQGFYQKNVIESKQIINWYLKNQNILDRKKWNEKIKQFYEYLIDDQQGD